jgi:sortase A
MPGQRGNAAIAGHRTTYGAPFNRIDELQPDDEILLSTAKGDFTYKVVPQRDEAGVISGHMIVSPNDVWVLNDAGDNRLTLTACHPKFSASQRIIVQALLVVPPALTPKLVSVPTAEGEAGKASVDTIQAPAIADEPVPVREDLDAGLGGDGSHKWPALFWGLMVALFMVGIGRSTRHWGRVPRWAISALPLMLVVFVFFEHLDRMLPAR